MPSFVRFQWLAKEAAAIQQIPNRFHKFRPIRRMGARPSNKNHIEGPVAQIGQALPHRFPKPAFDPITNHRAPLLLAHDETNPQPRRDRCVIAGPPHHMQHCHRASMGTPPRVDQSKVPIGPKALFRWQHGGILDGRVETSSARS
jgi:hypothetical protein